MLTVIFAVVIVAVMIGTMSAVARGFARAAAAAGGTGDRTAAVLLVTALLGAWLVLGAVLAVTGFFAPHPGETVPRIAWGLLPILAGVALLAASSGFRRTLDAVPADQLVGVQVYRALGGVFLVGWAFGLLPGVFALPAGVGDVLVGTAAPFVAKGMRSGHPRSRSWAILWNVVGIADLAAAVTLGVLSAPGPFQRFAFDRPNVAISQFPFVIIPTVLVPLSIVLHLFSLRSLKHAAGAAASAPPDRPSTGPVPTA